MRPRLTEEILRRGWAAWIAKGLEDRRLELRPGKVADLPTSGEAPAGTKADGNPVR